MVAGVVKFAGSPPKLEPIKVNKNREVCGASKDSEALVVGPEGGVRGSVVLIEGAKGKSRRASCCSTTTAVCSCRTWAP